MEDPRQALISESAGVRPFSSGIDISQKGEVRTVKAANKPVNKTPTVRTEHFCNPQHTLQHLFNLLDHVYPDVIFQLNK